MSVAALVVFTVHVATVGAQREADEGPAAHILQLPIGGQLPVVVFFAARWLSRDMGVALAVLALQLLAIAAALLPVYLLGL
jgi:hypothetical protein